MLEIGLHSFSLQRQQYFAPHSGRDFLLPEKQTVYVPTSAQIGGLFAPKPSD
jgi:hypothetical protein